MKKTVSIPVSIAGRINDPETAARIISNGEADIIGLARPLLADPDFVIKAKEGRVKEIRKCTACCHCFDKVIAATKRGQNAEIICAINPELGRESENLIKKAENPGHVVVVGGGPAGLEAARVASIRGHKVTLYEAENKVGGLINLSIIPPHKEELKLIPEYYDHQIKVHNIDLKLNTKFTAADLQNDHPDALIFATGAKPVIPRIPGLAESGFKTAIEILQAGTANGVTVLIIGGGMVGLETGEFLADMGKEVIVVEMDKIATDIGPTTRWGFISRIRRKMKILSQTRVLNITGNVVRILEKEKNEKEIKADLIIVASGMECDPEFAEETAVNEIKNYTIGSCKNPGIIDDAIKDGFEAGCKI